MRDKSRECPVFTEDWSVELNLFLERESLPTQEQWQSAVASAGFPIVMSQEFSPQSDSGHWPVRFTGASVESDSGFEYYLDGTPDFGRFDQSVLSAAPTADVVITFRTGGDPVELACGLYAAAALMKTAAGLLWDPQSDAHLSIPEAIAEAESAIRDLKLNEYLFLKPDKCAKRAPIEVETCVPGWVKCPGCNRRFALKDPNVWDGKKHLSCGQKIIPTGQVEELPPRKWWQFWRREP